MRQLHRPQSVAVAGPGPRQPGRLAPEHIAGGARPIRHVGRWRVSASAGDLDVSDAPGGHKRRQPQRWSPRWGSCLTSTPRPLARLDRPAATPAAARAPSGRPPGHGRAWWRLDARRACRRAEPGAPTEPRPSPRARAPGRGHERPPSTVPTVTNAHGAVARENDDSHSLWTPPSPPPPWSPPSPPSPLRSSSRPRMTPPSVSTSPASRPAPGRRCAAHSDSARGGAGLRERRRRALVAPALPSRSAALRARLASRLAPATVNKTLSALRGVLREAMRLGLDERRGLRARHRGPRVKGSREPKGRALAAGEVLALFKACDPATPTGARDAALAALLYGGGLRRAEAVAIDLADYNASTGALLDPRQGKQGADDLRDQRHRGRARRVAGRPR